MFRTLALLLIVPSAADCTREVMAAPALPVVNCSSQVQMFSLITEFVSGVCCTQPNDHTCQGNYPAKVRSRACANAVLQTGAACRPWLELPAQAFLRSQFMPAMDAAVSLCEAYVDKEPPLIMSSAASVTADTGMVCGASIVDGQAYARGAGGWTAEATVTAPKHLTLSVYVDVLWLPEAHGTTLYLYDGNSSAAKLIKAYNGTNLGRGRTLKLSHGSVFVRLVSTSTPSSPSPDGVYEPEAFSLKIGCNCRNAAGCGSHGSCFNNRCACKGGYTGGDCKTKKPNSTATAVPVY